MNKKEEITFTSTQELEEKIKEKEPKKLNFVGCRNCGATNVTLIKATDSYYCKFCFNKLGKKKFEKKGKK